MGVSEITRACLGVPIGRIIVFWGLYWGPPIKGNFHILFFGQWSFIRRVSHRVAFAVLQALGHLRVDQGQTGIKHQGLCWDCRSGWGDGLPRRHRFGGRRQDDCPQGLRRGAAALLHSSRSCRQAVFFCLNLSKCYSCRMTLSNLHMEKRIFT